MVGRPNYLINVNTSENISTLWAAIKSCWSKIYFGGSEKTQLYKNQLIKKILFECFNLNTEILTSQNTCVP